MKLKWLFSMLAISLVVLFAIFGLAGHDAAVAAQDASSKIETTLLDKFAAEGSADFIVRFTDQADLSPAYSMDWDARGEFVYNTLRDTAANSQVNGKAILDGAGLRYQTFIAGNELYVWSGTSAEANALAALPEVSTIRATRTFYVDPVYVTSPLANIKWAGDYLANNTLTTVGNSPDALAWGIVNTKADQFWSTFAMQGDGIKVANIDTGVQWNHPALDQAFACPGDPTNSSCWSDPSNICGAAGACDNAGHGTHTMGTMVADDDPVLTWQAGMAPNATWIACKGCESNSCSDYALNTCADWILAPGGNPINRPDVVNNSWGGGGGDPWYLAKVQAWSAAGTFPAFSAGNNYSCNAMGSPGDYQESFASAAHNSSNVIADFSSKGPSPFGHDPYTKPNISAPGVNVCSSVPGSGWSCGYSGTSMASPHSAGAVALLWSCNPALRGDIYGTFEALQNSAGTPPAGSCGAPPDGQGNYTYGYGFLDVLAAGNTVCAGVLIGTLEGHVLDQNSNPVAGATVTAVPSIEGNSINATTDPNGFYTMNLVAGVYDVTASKLNYTPETVTGVVVLDAQTTTQDFQITFVGGWLNGYVKDSNNTPVEGADVVAQPGAVATVTDATGFYSLELAVGTYNVTASKFNYQSQTVNGVVITEGATTVQDFELVYLGGWTSGPATCFDWYRLDGEFYPATGLIYFMGGRIDSTTTDGTIYSYDPVTGDCADTGADMPNPISNYTVNLVNNGTEDVLCTFGGRDPAGTSTLNVQCYDPIANTASIVTNLPAAWTGYTPGAQVVVDNMVYVFGGFNSTVGMIARTDKYDPVANTFTQLGDLGLARSYIMATSVDGIIYAFGGDTWDGASLIAQTISEKMDPAVGTWDNAGVADLPVAGDEGVAYGFDSTAPYAFANQIIIATLSQWSSNSNEVVKYDVATNAYDVAFPDTIEPRRNHAGVFVPINTADPADGLPGMWVFGGWLTGDAPPFAGTEFFPMSTISTEPDIEVTAPPLVATLLPNQLATFTVTIANVGGADLTWDLTSASTWISALPASGTLAPDESVDVTVTFDSTGLAKGHYVGTVIIASNDPVDPTITLDATLDVYVLSFTLPVVYK